MPSALYYFGVCVLASDVYVFGGFDEDEDSTDTVYRYNTETSEWNTLTPMSDNRYRHGVCVLEGKVYVVGGLDIYDGEQLCSVCRYVPRLFRVRGVRLRPCLQRVQGSVCSCWVAACMLQAELGPIQ